MIHGFGADGNLGYDRKLRAHIADAHGFAVVSVEYHCFRSRPETGATYEFPDESALALQGLLCRLGIHEPVTGNNALRLIQDIGPKLRAPLRLKATLRPADGTVQNFGVIQALDHLHVLDHLKREGFPFDRSRVILFGSSHGGYLAHLLFKFAPNTFSAILDNSGYTQANRYFLGIGSEFTKTSGNLILDCNVAGAWTHANVFAKDYFGPAREQIRDAAQVPHLLAVAAASRKDCRIRCVNSVKDSVSPIGFKRAQTGLYRQLGFDASLLEFGGGGPDPDFVKSSQHADLSLRSLFDRFVPELSEARLGGPADSELGTTLEFPCAWLDYRVTHGGDPPSVRLEVRSP